MRARHLVVVLLLAQPVLAQTRDDWLYLNPSLLLSAPRPMALSGAWAGIGEGAEGMAANYASVAHRSPRLTRTWDWDATFSVLATPVPRWRDLENNGRAEDTVAPVEGQLGLLFQYRRLGVGFFTRVSSRNVCLDAACAPLLDTTTLLSGLVAGAAFSDDQLRIALGLHLSQATFSLGADRWRYEGASLGGGLIWRPHRRPYRVGLQVISAHLGTLRETPVTSALLGRPIYRGIVTPGRVSVGVSLRVGEGAHRYNRVSKVVLEELPRARQEKDLPPYDELHDVAPGAVLLSAQLDVLLPAEVRATTLRPFLFGEEAVRAGENVAAVPRAGVEWEALERRLRLRAGVWLEPAMVQGTWMRPHATAGFEVFLFHLLEAWSIAAFTDVSRGYFAAGGGIGFWQ